MTTESIKTGERLSFYQLFAEKGLKVEVPIIQRDYAQGRSSKTEVRDNFLNALYLYLEEDLPFRDLDFVYGKIFDPEEAKVFIPLDGQQRLTTLFLLHWFLALKEGRMEEFQKVMLRDGKSRFTYETRVSSREFCNALVARSVQYSGPETMYPLSEKIRNEGWFYFSWENDPTVSGMLNMLDAIEVKFDEATGFYDRLIQEETPIITFQFLDLEAFSLTDDLYIKMNSRGKPLNSFENFKARFELEIEDLFKDEPNLYSVEVEGGSVEKSHSEYFAHQIDTNWLNYFWELSGKNPSAADQQLMNFIRVVLTDHAIVGGGVRDENALRILLKTQDARFGKHGREDISFYSLKELGAISQETILALMNAFDQVLNLGALTQEDLPDPFHYDPLKMIMLAAGHQLVAENRVRHFAFLNYLIRYPDNLQGLSQWMRVIYNLTENTRLEGANDIQLALIQVNTLLDNAPEILQDLSDGKLEIGFFYSRQVGEERLKATLILQSADWKRSILDTEKSSFLKGQLGFLLEFCGALGYFLENENCGWDPEEDIQYLSAFQDYAKKARAVYDEGLPPNYLWERTVLTKGDYMLSATSNRWHFLTTGLKDRDFSWKRLLRLNLWPGENQYWDNKRSYVKAVFDDPRFKASDIQPSCISIIKDKVGDWRDYFIEEPKLIEDCEKGFIRYDGEKAIYLLRTTRLTLHYELFTRAFYFKEVEGKIFPPFKFPQYHKGFGYDGWSHIIIGFWTFQKKEYLLGIFFNNNYGFNLSLTKTKDYKGEAHFAPEIQNVCKGEGFKFHDNGWKGYSRYLKNEENLLTALNSLTSKLQILATK